MWYMNHVQKSNIEWHSMWCEITKRRIAIKFYQSSPSFPSKCIFIQRITAKTMEIIKFGLFDCAWFERCKLDRMRTNKTNVHHHGFIVDHIINCLWIIWSVHHQPAYTMHSIPINFMFLPFAFGIAVLLCRHTNTYTVRRCRCTYWSTRFARKEIHSFIRISYIYREIDI